MTKDYIDYRNSVTGAQPDYEPEVYECCNLYEHLANGKQSGNWNDEYYGCPSYKKYVEDWC